MDNKKLGIMIIIAALLVLAMLVVVRHYVVKSYQAEIDRYIEAGEACPSDPNICPHEQRSRAQIPIFIAGAFLLALAALGAYLIFFEKSQKEIVSVLKKHEKLQTDDEKFNILLKGLTAEEKKVIIAVREQDGITQQTLRLRTDLHKSKLSIVLDGLEKKGIVKRVDKGKTKQVFLKIAI